MLAITIVLFVLITAIAVVEVSKKVMELRKMTPYQVWKHERAVRISRAIRRSRKIWARQQKQLQKELQLIRVSRMRRSILKKARIKTSSRNKIKKLWRIQLSKSRRLRRWWREELHRRANAAKAARRAALRAERAEKAAKAAEIAKKQRARAAARKKMRFVFNKLTENGLRCPNTREAKIKALDMASRRAHKLARKARGRQIAAEMAAKAEAARLKKVAKAIERKNIQWFLSWSANSYEFAMANLSSRRAIEKMAALYDVPVGLVKARANRFNLSRRNSLAAAIMAGVVNRSNLGKAGKDLFDKIKVAA